MKYRNKVTGITIDVACTLSGDQWEPVGKAKPEPKPVEAEAEEKPKAKPRSKKK